MKSSGRLGITIFLFALVFAFAQTAHSSTTVTVNPGGIFDDIGSFQFDFSAPYPTLAQNPSATVTFNTTTYPEWGVGLNLARTNYSGLDFSGVNPLVSATLVTFGIDVSLSGWSFGKQDGSTTFLEGQDFIVTNLGTNYVVNAVPIPAAVWLLGSGVVGLVALKRRKKA